MVFQSIQKMVICGLFGVVLFNQSVIAGEAVFTEKFVWDEVVGNVCIVQDTEYEYTSYGQMFVKTNEYKEWNAALKPEQADCLLEKKFIPKTLCDELFNVDEKPIKEDFLDAIYSKNKATLDNLEALNQCGWKE